MPPVEESLGSAWEVHDPGMAEMGHNWDGMKQRKGLQTDPLGRHPRLEADDLTSELLAHGGHDLSDPMHWVDGGGEEELGAIQ